MRRKSEPQGRSGLKEQRELNDALDAMTAEDLRKFVRDALEGLDDEPRGVLHDSLIARAARSRSGWRPAKPPSGIVSEVKRFAEAARRDGYAEPEEVDAYLRQGTKAFLAGEHATAREVFEALLPPVADAEIDLGQHELVDEVLTVDIHECAERYVVSVYATTTLEDRAKAIHHAMDAVDGVASFWRPLEQMEGVATAPLPDLDAFLPRWLLYLEGQPSPDGEWDEDRDRWIREAVLRLEGATGLERIARKTKKPQALQAWCAALADKGEWAAALQACDDAVELVGTSHWRGGFLDGAALAAKQLGRGDAAKRLEAAWLGAPSMVRLLRWLGACTPEAGTVVKRAKLAIKQCPPKAAQQLGLLHVLSGDAQAAATLLAKAPGLGWSSDDHPGHLLFPAFAGLLAEGTGAKLAPELLAGLRETPWGAADLCWDDEDEEEAPPKLDAPSILELIESVCSEKSLDSQGRLAMLKAMRTATTKRAEGILANKRRRHYGHVAALIACCLEVSPVVGEQDSIAVWIDGLRRKYSRFYAFQGELKTALGSIGVA